MGIEIDDGRGRGLSASVSEDNRLNVSSKSAPRPFYVSRDSGLSFSVSSIDAAAAADDVILYLKNTSSTRNIFLGSVHVSAVEAVLWKLWRVTGTAAGSTALTPTNLNASAGISAEATVRGNGAVTGLTLSELIHVTRHDTNSKDTMGLLGALILGPNDAIGVEYDTGTGGIAEVTVEFHYETVGRKN